jgi:hypothetical protein
VLAGWLLVRPGSLLSLDGWLLGRPAVAGED